MSANKRYTWTVSVIAMLERNEPKNGPIVEEAYAEFEDSIMSVKNANKDIKFVIYNYDVSTETVFIRQSKVSQRKYQLETVREDHMNIDHFYRPPYEHLTDFFDEFVAKKQKNPDEEHKHFLIIWGHATGLGFLRQSVESHIQQSFAEGGEHLEVSEIEKIADKVHAFNKVKTRLSFTSGEIPFESFRPDLPNTIKELKISNEQKTAIEKVTRLITPTSLAEILEKGLSKDNLSVTNGKGKAGNQKIQFFLCLSCYVNMVETGYALKNLVNVYVAPQTHVSFFGYNYAQLFKLLSKHPESDDETIATNISHNYLRKYLTLKPTESIDNFMIYNVDYKDDVSFSAIYLSKFDEIPQLILNFRDIVFQVPKFREHLQNARRRCLPLSKTGFTEIAIIDYHNYVSEVFQLIFESGSNPGLFRNSTVINSCYLHEFAITNYNPGILSQSKFEEHTFRSQSPGSFSIFLPNPRPVQLEEDFLDMYLNQKNEFLQKSEWDCIIRLVLENNSKYPLCQTLPPKGAIEG